MSTPHSFWQREPLRDSTTYLDQTDHYNILPIDPRAIHQAKHLQTPAQLQLSPDARRDSTKAQASHLGILQHVVELNNTRVCTTVLPTPFQLSRADSFLVPTGSALT